MSEVTEEFLAAIEGYVVSPARVRLLVAEVRRLQGLLRARQEHTDGLMRLKAGADREANEQTERVTELESLAADQARAIHQERQRAEQAEARVAELEGERDGWRDDSRRMGEIAEHWRARFEQAAEVAHRVAFAYGNTAGVAEFDATMADTPAGGEEESDG